MNVETRSLTWDRIFAVRGGSQLKAAPSDITPVPAPDTLAEEHA
jgi:hypothetical protein